MNTMRLSELTVGDVLKLGPFKLRVDKVATTADGVAVDLSWASGGERKSWTLSGPPSAMRASLTKLYRALAEDPLRE